MIRWPLREALRGYRWKMRQNALDDFRHSVLEYASMFPGLSKEGIRKLAPKPPDFSRKRPKVSANGKP